jgi:OmpA-OmpF porin, OOP family
MKSASLLLATVILLSITATAQSTKQNKPLVAFHIHFADYSTPGLIKDSSFSKAFAGDDWYNPSKKSFGLGVSWIKNLTPKIDFSANLSGTFSNFPKLFVKADSIGQAGFTPQLDALLHFKALKPEAKVNPFLTAGVGAGSFGDAFAAYAPLGVGLNIRFKEGAYLISQAQWRLAFTGINSDYLFYTIGFAQTLGKQKTEIAEPVKEPVATIPPDKDGDGVEDSKDECPDVSGTVIGCPDADGDGVADKNDACPNDKGTLNGCPDADGDGVTDKEDKCPDAKGTINGCPDTDGDGVIDADDKCPDVAGKTDNNGCPEIKQEVVQKVNYAAKNIFFKFASDEILKQSFAPLDELVKVMKENPSLQLTIAAHADSKGTPQANMMWSERRAKAVADYFISKGIDASRITYKGYGDTQPVADNKTEAGRAKNRRVEMKMDY